jgi:hypothetical protein
MRFTGPCRLIFGVPRAIEGVSTQFNGLTIERHTLYSNNVALATYDPTYDAWWSRSSEMRCHAFRIESVDVAHPTIGDTREYRAGFPSRTARYPC